MEIIVKSNGYEAKELQELINRFNVAVEKEFPEAKVKHFYYGDRVDMVDVILPNSEYGSFNIYKNRVSFNGHSCSHDTHRKFTELTLNDECFNGKL